MNQKSSDDVSKEDIPNIQQDKKKWSYALSHMTTCIATDFTPVIASYFQGKSTGNFNLLQHFGGEIIGDIAAVPIAVKFDDLFPNVSDAIISVSETALKPLYMFSAHISADEWAKENNIDKSSKEYDDFAQKEYKSTIKNIPIQVYWTVASVVGNIVVQKNPICRDTPFLNNLFYNEDSLKDVAVPVLKSAIITLGLQTIGRVVLPNLMNDIDNFIDDKICTPLTNIFTGKNSEKLAHIEPLRDHYNSNNALIAY
jgi:hypothetical protein